MSKFDTADLNDIRSLLADAAVRSRSFCIQWAYPLVKKTGQGGRSCCGAGNRTRTCTREQWNLNPPSLPIPPCPRIQLTVDNGQLTVIVLRF